VLKLLETYGHGRRAVARGQLGRSSDADGR
jgi:hypothetical protein